MSPEAAIEVVPFGEAAVRVTLPEALPRKRVLAALRAMPGAVDVVVVERHAAVLFDPASAETPDVAAALRTLEAAPPDEATGRVITIGIRYDGPDLEALAAWANLDPEEVVRRHLARTYEVQVVGFQPGFAYLGPVDPQIAKPRLASPRIRVPACSVGIAGGRTGIYPFVSPGGWNLIGTAVGFTPFDPERGALLQLGDKVRFERV